MRCYLRSKYGYVPITWFLEPAWLCVLLYRLSRRALLRGNTRWAGVWMQLNSLITGADIQPASALGPGLLIPSPVGVTISARADAGLTVMALAGIGGNVPTRDVGAGPGLPVLGRDVTVGQFVGIQGAILVGDAAIFAAGAGSVVNVPAGARMAPTVQPEPGPPPVPLPARAPPPPCGHGAWRETWAQWQADIDRSREEMVRLAPAGRPAPRRLRVLLTGPLLALLTYRISHWLALNGWRRLAGLLCGLNLLAHKLTIPPASCLGPGVLMPHLASVVVHGCAGARLAVFANAVCSCEGDALAEPAEAAPQLGDDVMVGGHSSVFGPVTLGDRVQIGPKTQTGLDVGTDMQVFDPHSRGAADTVPTVARPTGEPSQQAAASPWSTLRRRARQDRARWREHGAGRSGPAFPSQVCATLHRLSHAFHCAGWRRPARWCALLNTYLTGADISPASVIEGGLSIPHPAGVALHGRAGRDLTVMAMAGMGTLLGADDGLPPLADAPVLGPGVRLAHHSGVFGPVMVGDGVSLRPGGFVHRCAASGVTLIQKPLRVRDRLAVERARAQARALRHAGSV